MSAEGKIDLRTVEVAEGDVHFCEDAATGEYFVDLHALPRVSNAREAARVGAFILRAAKSMKAKDDADLAGR